MRGEKKMGKGKILKKLASGIMAFAVTLTTLSALPQLEASAAPATPRMIGKRITIRNHARRFFFL